MNGPEKYKVSEPSGEWGGPWTEKKLEAFSKYVRAYLTIMQKNPYWKTIYFDGFAGSGTRKKKEVKKEIYRQLKITEEEERLYKGSAERVLGLPGDIAFDYYYFIDNDATSLEKLQKKLGDRYGEKHLVFRAGDANIQVRELAEALRTNKYAALIFLDPFGMQVDWASIAGLKGTRSDLWLLIPTGVVVNRLLDRAGKLELSEKLESFFGLPIEEIKSYFYKKEKQ